MRDKDLIDDCLILEDIFDSPGDMGYGLNSWTIVLFTLFCTSFESDILLFILEFLIEMTVSSYSSWIILDDNPGGLGDVGTGLDVLVLFE